MRRSPVMRIRRLSSGTRVMFWKPSSTGSDLHGPAGGDDLPDGRLAGPIHLHDQFPGDLPVSEQLDAPRAGAFHQARLAKRLDVDDGARLEPGQLLHVDDGRLFPEDVDEPALREPPLEGHLPAFVPGLRPAAAARLETLVPLAGGLPEPGAFAPADALARAFRPFCGAQIREFHDASPTSSIRTRNLTFSTIPRISGVSSRTTGRVNRVIPSPRTTFRWYAVCPLNPRTSVMRSFPLMTSPLPLSGPEPRRSAPRSATGKAPRSSPSRGCGDCCSPGTWSGCSRSRWTRSRRGHRRPR